MTYPANSRKQNSRKGAKTQRGRTEQAGKWLAGGYTSNTDNPWTAKKWVPDGIRVTASTATKTSSTTLNAETIPIPAAKENENIVQPFLGLNYIIRVEGRFPVRQ